MNATVRECPMCGREVVYQQLPRPQQGELLVATEKEAVIGYDGDGVRRVVRVRHECKGGSGG